MVYYNFCGNVPNEQIVEYYNKNKIDCFVHTSEIEGGAPVSISEALSAGIPIIATKVGGVDEMIKNNGILLESNPSAKDIADAIEKILYLSCDEKKYMEEQSLKIWKAKFNAKDNAKKFLGYLGEMSGFKNMIFITRGYPFLTNQRAFVETELIEMLRNYNIKMISCIYTKVTNEMRQNANNSIKRIKTLSESSNKFELIEYNAQINFVDYIFSMSNYFFDRQTKKEIGEILVSKRKVINIWESIKYYTKAKHFDKWFEQNIVDENILINSIVYTYWNYEEALGIALSNRCSNLITRVHGYDFQDEQWKKGGRKPFLSTIDDFLKLIIFPCENAKKYYQDKIGKNRKGYYVSYLGSINEENVIKEKKKERFKIVSCAYMIPLKRINLLIDALEILSEKNIDIDWIHFGDGVMRDELINKIKMSDLFKEGMSVKGRQ